MFFKDLGDLKDEKGACGARCLGSVVFMGRPGTVSILFIQIHSGFGFRERKEDTLSLYIGYHSMP